MTNLVLEFFGKDPLIASTLVFAFCCTIAAFVIVGRTVYQERRQQKAEAREAARRRELSAALSLTHDLEKRGPTGWRRAS